MIKVKQISVHRREGSAKLCVEVLFKSFAEADAHFSFYSHTYPKEGYDKHDVNVVWEDGQEVAWRLDAHGKDNEYYRNDNVSNCLQQMVRTYVSYGERYANSVPSPAMKRWYALMLELNSGKYQLK